MSTSLAQGVFLTWSTTVILLAVVFRLRDIGRRWRDRTPTPVGTGRGASGPGRAPTRWEREGARGLRTVVVAGATTVSALGWGAAVLSWIQPEGLSDPMRILLDVLLGWGILSWILAILGFLGRLTRVWTILALAAGPLLGAATATWSAATVLPPDLGTFSPAAIVAALFCVGILLVLFVACFAPPRGFDTHAYHLELPRRYAEHGRIEYVPFMAHSPWPQAVHMLFVPGFQFRCTHLPQVLSYLMGVSVAGLVFETVRVHAGTLGGLVAVLAILAVSEFVFQMSEASVDVGLAAFTLAAVISWASWSGSPQPALLILAGVFAGFAASTKMTALLLTGLLAAAVFLQGVLTGRGIPAAGDGAILLLVSSVVALPWYLRSMLLTGNPVFHFATRLFRTRNWSPSSEAAHRAIARADGWGPIQGPVGWARYLGHQLVKSPRGWGAGIMALAPMALFYPLDRPTLHIGILSLVLLMATLKMTNQIRLMMGAAAGLAVVSGATFSVAIAQAESAWYVPVLVVAIGTLAGMGAVDASHHKLRAAIDRSRVRDFLGRFLPYHDDFAWINKHVPRDARILLWTTRGYLLERDYIWLPPWQQGIFDFTRIKNANDFWRELKHLGVTHVYFTDYEISRTLFGYLYELHEGMVRLGLILEERVFESRYRLYRVV